MEIVQAKDIQVGDGFYTGGGSQPQEVIEVAVGEHRAAIKYRNSYTQGRVDVNVGPADHEFPVERGLFATDEVQPSDN